MERQIGLVYLSVYSKSHNNFEDKGLDLSSLLDKACRCTLPAPILQRKFFFVSKVSSTCELTTSLILIITGLDDNGNDNDNHNDEHYNNSDKNHEFDQETVQGIEVGTRCKITSWKYGGEVAPWLSRMDIR